MQRVSERPPLITKEAVLSILAGMILGPLAYYFDLSRSIFSYFAILIHELGHSFTCWIFGFFSVPAFDFTYGGGRAPMNIDHRYFFLVALVYLFFAWLIWLNRKSPLGIVTVVIFILIYSVMKKHEENIRNQSYFIRLSPASLSPFLSIEIWFFKK
ncbi:MAG: hypothetical protein A2020_04760 [Lentisphaerae bacterium GWF2_45_14]|nr:MAG: hypothetical protein A2020_04760 [Lentisphaerae bacterium GWF2_45_14]